MRTGVFGFALLMAATANGGIEHTILHGASVGRVRGWVDPESLPGFSRADLQAVAESGLRQAGIRVDSRAETELFVGAIVTRELPGACFVHLEAGLSEPAKLERNGYIVEAFSWHGSSGVASNTPESCAKLATEAAQRLVGDFVENYRAMNPGQAPR